MLLFSHSLVSDPLGACGLQHSRPPCSSLSPEFPQTHVRLFVKGKHFKRTVVKCMKRNLGNTTKLQSQNNTEKEEKIKYV